VQEILITKIRTDKSVQSRVAINADYVTELVDIIKSGKRLPPIDVYKDGDELWVSDGFHRLRAAEEAGKRTIRAEIHKGSVTDAAWASCAANQEHGLRRTNSDKRHAVEMALQLHPEKSDRLIADHVGVSREMVLASRRQVMGEVKLPTREGKDGKTYLVPPPPRGNPSPAVGKSAPPPPQTKAKPPERRDSVNAVIPDHLHKLFDRIPEIVGLTNMLSEIKKVLRAAESTGDPLFAEVPFNAVYTALENAYHGLDATIPYAVCPWCHGVTSKECRGCNKRGVIGEHRYKTTVPREMKKND
jgi:hypothetical protein